MLPFASQFEAVFQFFSTDPTVAAMQTGMVAAACVLVFLILFTTRDIILRSRSLLAQLGSIVLVAGLPVLGFLLYMLIRPSRTLKERQLERDIEDMLRRLPQSPAKKMPQQQSAKPAKVQKPAVQQPAPVAV